MYEAIADHAYRHPKRVLVLAAVFVVVCGALGGPVAAKLSTTTRNFEDPGSESVRTRNLIEQRSGVNPDTAAVVLVRAGADVRSPAVRSRVERIAAMVARDPAVARVLSVYSTRSPSFVSRDGKSTYLAVAFKSLSANEDQTAAKRLDKELSKLPGVSMGGAVLAGTQIGTQVGKDLGMAEGLAFPILFVLLFFIFRSGVAAFLPLIGGAMSILATFLALRVINGFTPLSIFALNLTTALGLGLAIDYNLFIVSRYREELARFGPGREALVRTVASAGRTAAFSGLTVAAALASLLVFPQPFLYSMGIGGILVALFSAASAIFVLPAILALLGNRVNALSPKRFRRSLEAERPDEHGFWHRLATRVMSRPVAFAAGAATLMIVLGLPFLAIRFTGVDATDLPRSASARQVTDAVRTEFPPSPASAVYIAVEAPRSESVAVTHYADDLRTLPSVAAVQGPTPLGQDAWQLAVVPREPALASSSKTLVHDIRGLAPPFTVLAGGQTAMFVDQGDSLAARLPLAVGILVLTTLLFLFAMTGSVVLPVKSLLMNLLTLSATFGLLVLIFQDGRLESVLRYTSQGALEMTQPILLAAIVFGLSTDYCVFLLARIKELRDAGAANEDAVAGGLERTGRLVTSAALLFCIAVGAFATSKIIFIKELGVGMALAVIIDATIVRGLLVPSLMRLLGDWNWWAPGPLRRLHDRFGPHEPALSQD